MKMFLKFFLSFFLGRRKTLLVVSSSPTKTIVGDQKPYDGEHYLFTKTCCVCSNTWHSNVPGDEDWCFCGNTAGRIEKNKKTQTKGEVKMKRLWSTADLISQSYCAGDSTQVGYTDLQGLFSALGLSTENINSYETKFVKGEHITIREKCKKYGSENVIEVSFHPEVEKAIKEDKNETLPPNAPEAKKEGFCPSCRITFSVSGTMGWFCPQCGNMGVE